LNIDILISDARTSAAWIHQNAAILTLTRPVSSCWTVVSLWYQCYFFFRRYYNK